MNFQLSMKLQIIPDKKQKNFIREAMDKIEEISCVKFVAYDRQRHDDYVKVSGEQQGCFSQLGRQGS